VGAPLPSTIKSVSLPGRHGLLGQYIPMLPRPSLKPDFPSQELTILLFFPDAGLALSEFARELANGFKTSALLADHQQRIHCIVNTSSLVQFDRDVKNVPSGPLVWADVNGNMASAFGVRPKVEAVDVQSIFGSQQNAAARQTQYTEQVQPCVFFIQGNKIVKSPAFQPRFQGHNIGTLKNALDYCVQQAKLDYAKMTSPSSFGAEMSLTDIQQRFPDGWKEYLHETGQSMDAPPEVSSKATPAQPSAQVPVANSASVSAAQLPQAAVAIAPSQATVQPGPRPKLTLKRPNLRSKL
jgi:hypothetical protein